MSEEIEMDMDECEEISCYNCGAIKVQLWINNEVHNYTYRQIVCKPCWFIWESNGGCW